MGNRGGQQSATRHDASPARNTSQDLYASEYKIRDSFPFGWLGIQNSNELNESVSFLINDHTIEIPLTGSASENHDVTASFDDPSNPPLQKSFTHDVVGIGPRIIGQKILLNSK